jgi:N6-adenosine-specific RNA methylase IME4
MTKIASGSAVAVLLDSLAEEQSSCILADLSWQFINRTRKVAPEYRRLSRYGTMASDVISTLPIAKVTMPTAHLYLGVPNALLPDCHRVMQACGLEYKSNIA